jgi:hypothetical protein
LNLPWILSQQARDMNRILSFECSTTDLGFV